MYTIAHAQESKNVYTKGRVLTTGDDMTKNKKSVLIDRAVQLVEDIEDISEECSLSDEEKLFFVEVLAAFWGAENPNLGEVIPLLSYEPRVKEACREFFKKHKLKKSDVLLH